MKKHFDVVILGGGHSGCHRPAGSQGLCTHRHWPVPDVDSSDQHPRDQHLGQSGTQHGRSLFCGWTCRGAAVAVLVGPPAGSPAGCHGLQADRWSGRLIPTLS